MRTILIVLAVSATSSRAVAYRTESGARWEQRFSVGIAGEPPLGISATELVQTTQYALGRWTEPACARLEYDFRGSDGLAADEADGRVTVEVIHAGWSTAGFASDASATTRVIYRDDLSEIADADIFLNAETFDWTLGPSDGRRRNLLAALVHEFGHVVGLLHPCDSEVACDAPPSVMAAFFDDVDASLREDDILGVCALYESTNCEDCSPPVVPPVCTESCGELGDPCGQDGDCASSTCHVGVCSAPCHSRACPGRWQCGIEARCDPPEGEVFAAPCQSGDDCVSGVCVFSNETGLCSRSCDDDCPSGFECTSIELDSYCAPTERMMSQGCSTALYSSPEDSTAALLSLLALLALRRLRGHKC